MTSGELETLNKLQPDHDIQISRFKEVIKKTSPHRHDNYMELIFLREGSGFHWIESQRFTVSAPEVFILQPGQLHCWEFTSIPKGFVLLVRLSGIDPVKEPELSFLLSKLTVYTRLQLPAGGYPSVILEGMMETSLVKCKYTVTMLMAWLRILVANLLADEVTSASSESGYSDLFVRFRSLLLRDSLILHKVRQYSDQLYTTPQNLNAVCRKHDGRTASSIIHERLVQEAKRYILYTDKKISEISELLAFPEPSTFVKFFRRKTGLTPGRFRNMYFQ